MNFYTSGNKAGKLLDHLIKGHYLKSHIPFLHHPVNKNAYLIHKILRTRAVPTTPPYTILKRILLTPNQT